MQLEQLLGARADLWRGHATPAATPCGLNTGFVALNEALSGHGWPAGGLSEVLTAHQGAGLALLLPLLAGLSRQPRWLLWVEPPHLPFAPALAAAGLDLRRILIVRAGDDAAWAAEQGLRSGTCAAVLAWTGPDAVAAGRADTGQGKSQRLARWTPAALRRLQLAAADHQTPALLLRPPSAAGETSPAALRLHVGARADGLEVTLLKQRGGRPGQRLWLPGRPDAAAHAAAADAATRAVATNAAAVVAADRGAADGQVRLAPPHEPVDARQAMVAGADCLVAKRLRPARRRRAAARR
jgi:cell division inhibitor SulA